MFSDLLLHPNHIIPASALIPTLVELTDKAVSHPLMEPHAVLCQVLVFTLLVSDTGICIQDVLLSKDPFQRQI